MNCSKPRSPYCKEETFEIYPDFQQKGLIDITEYDQGNGKVAAGPGSTETNEKTITITEIPYGTTTSSLIDSIEKRPNPEK